METYLRCKAETADAATSSSLKFNHSGEGNKDLMASHSYDSSHNHKLTNENTKQCIAAREVSLQEAKISQFIWISDGSPMGCSEGDVTIRNVDI